MGAVRGIAAREARDMHSACVRAVCRLPQTNSVRQRYDRQFEQADTPAALTPTFIMNPIRTRILNPHP